MKKDVPAIYSVSMRDLSEAPGAAAELLSALEFDFTTRTDADTKEVAHTLYFQDEAGADAALSSLSSLSKEWLEFGIKVESLQKGLIKKEDWAESWKAHFKPIEISPTLAVVPSWESFPSKPGQAVVKLDPGMSFGTGQHATTKFCLYAIDRFSKELKGSSMLDAGCGSGILAIAAWLLGCRPVCAFDLDPDAVMIARENFEKNGLPSSAISSCVSSLLGFSGGPKEKYDIVAANILSSALVEGAPKLLSLVKPGGRLILAGILEKEYASVEREFVRLGCAPLFAETEKEWRGGAFSVPS